MNNELNTDLNMINNSTAEESESFIKINKIQNDIIEKSSNLENSSEEDKEDVHIRKIFESNKSIISNILLLAGEIAIIIYCTQIKEISVIYLCRTYGIEISEALSSFTILFDIFSLTIPFAFTQGYSFKASDAYAEKDYKYLGRLTNKTNLAILMLSLISILTIFAIILPIIGLFLKNESAIYNLKIILLWHALGLPITYLQFVQFRYLTAINQGNYASLFAVVACIFEFGFAYLFINVLGTINFGIGMSITFGFTLNYIMNLVYIRYYKPCPESLIPLTEGMYDNFWEYIKYSLVLGAIVFISYLSMGILPFYGLLLGDTDYTLTNIFTFIMGLLTNDPFPIAINILINYLIAIKQTEKLNRVLAIGFLISSVVLLLLSCLIYFGFNLVAGLFSDQTLIIEKLSEYRLWFLGCLIILYYHNFTAEVLSAIGGENYSLFTNVAGKIIVTGAVILICLYGYNLGFKSILIGVIIGQICTLIMNITYYIYLLSNDGKLLKENIKEIEEFTSKDKKDKSE